MACMQVFKMTNSNPGFVNADVRLLNADEIDLISGADGEAYDFWRRQGINAANWMEDRWDDAVDLWKKVT